MATMLMTEPEMIRNEAEYDSITAQVERLFGSPAGSPEAELFLHLATLMEAYEEEHYPIAPPSPYAAGLYELEKQGCMSFGVAEVVVDSQNSLTESASSNRFAKESNRTGEREKVYA